MAEMKRSTLYIILIVLTLVLILLVVGCGVASGGHRPSDKTDPTTTDTSAGTTAPEETPGSNNTNPTNPGNSTEPTVPGGNTEPTVPGGNTEPTNPGGDSGSSITPPVITWKTGYIASPNASVSYYKADGTAAGTINRGTQVEYLSGSSGIYQIRHNGISAHLEKNASVVDSLDKIVPEHTKYIKSAVNLRDVNGRLLAPLAEKGDDLTIIGYDYMNDDGSVHMYEVNLDGDTGYVMPWYMENTEEAALVNYDHNGCYTNNHSQRGDRYGGGGAANLDYFPREKANFADNVMPDEVRAFYLNHYGIRQVDNYINLAKQCDINAFVVDVMDDTNISYDSDVMKQYSPSTEGDATSTKAEFAAAIKKLKDAGFYVIGRITVFKDYFFAIDNKTSNPETTVTDNTGKLLKLNGTYWPSGYSRLAWQYKVDLAVEAVELMGFNEIQYDYVRFPDLTSSYEKNGTIDYHNTYNETKAQAIQRFLMYASDILHEKGVYVSADVFGETCNNYVAAYGQYWPAISNVVDVISGMPYPDHWSKDYYSDGTVFIPWENPYYTISRWGNTAAKRQNEIPTPAIVRTWIQAYDAIYTPKVHYGADEAYAQISALRDSGCTGGYMTWYGGNTPYDKYLEMLPAFTAPEDE